ncbi:hypothetical protein PENTCL1PPCAC_7924, partial [Pristionchus entomophagus]
FILALFAQCNLHVTFLAEMSGDSEQHWDVATATDVYEKKFNDLDIVHDGREVPESSTNSVFSLPLVITICLVLAIVASLLVFFIRRACCPSLEHQPLPTEDNHIKKNGSTSPV